MGTDKIEISKSVERRLKAQGVCKYCRTKLVDKRVYQKSFIMDYCSKCDTFFPKE